MNRLSDLMPATVWDTVAQELEANSGVALLELPEAMEETPSDAFVLSREAFAALEQDPLPFANWIIPENVQDSSRVTGYHPPAGVNSWSSRYNEHRQGLVWSNSETISLRLPCSERDGKNCTDRGVFNEHFEGAAKRLEDLLHEIAERVLVAVEHRLELQSGWFQQHVGPTRSCSQWHIKSYVVPACHVASCLLPVHTDPSLITVIIHDRPGKQTGGLGLQYRRQSANPIPRPTTPQWSEIPRAGHGIAVIMVGSLLGRMTGQLYPPCKHRVVHASRDNGPGGSVDCDSNNDAEFTSDRIHRMAATLFLRPLGTAFVQIPPSPRLTNVTLHEHSLTFAAWNERVSRNYRRSKRSRKTS